jgi:hypothetical protein
MVCRSSTPKGEPRGAYLFWFCNGGASFVELLNVLKQVVMGPINVALHQKKRVIKRKKVCDLELINMNYT